MFDIILEKCITQMKKKSYFYRGRKVLKDGKEKNKDSCHVNFVMSKIVFKKSTDNTTPPCTSWVCVIRM